MRLRSFAAANAKAEAQVVLPTPPLPPKKSIRFLSRLRISAAGEIVQRRMLHTHSPVPNVEFFKKIRIDVHEVNGCGIRQSDQFHKTQQEEKIVQFHQLPAESFLITRERHAMKKITDILPNLTPIHAGMIAVNGSNWVLSYEF